MKNDVVGLDSRGLSWRTGLDIRDQDVPRIHLLRDHEYGGEEDDGEDGVHESASGQDHGARPNAFAGQAAGHLWVILSGQPDETAQGEEVEGIHHVGQDQGVSSHLPHPPLVGQVVRVAGFLEILGAFDFAAVPDLDNPGHQVPVEVFGGLDFDEGIAGQLGQVVGVDQVGVTVQENGSPPGVQAENLGGIANAELQHLDPVKPGSPEMAQLVDYHQDQQHGDESQKSEEDSFHQRGCPATAAARSVAQESAASRSSMLSAGAG